MTNEIKRWKRWQCDTYPPRVDGDGIPIEDDPFVLASDYDKLATELKGFKEERAYYLADNARLSAELAAARRDVVEALSRLSDVYALVHKSARREDE